jgi:hypothetical protein
MRHRGGIGRIVALAFALLLAVAGNASAHVTKVSGPFEVEMGWGNEPAIAGFENFVEVAVSDRSGAPVSAGADALDVQVSFGDARVSLPLLPDEEPGELRAALVPTRPGTYAFHITGTLRGREVDLASTCSEATFDCVVPVSDVEFPVKDPSISDIAQRLSRELPRAEQSRDTADQAQGIAIVAVALAAVAFAIAVVVGLRSRRKKN